MFGFLDLGFCEALIFKLTVIFGGRREDESQAWFDNTLDDLTLVANLCVADKL